MGDEENAAATAPPVTTHFNSNLRLPPELNLTSGNVSENFKTWKRKVEIYLRATGSTCTMCRLQRSLTVVVKTY